LLHSYTVQPIQDTTANTTCFLKPASEPTRPLKFIVDGSQDFSVIQQLDAHGALALDPVKLLSERHMRFACYAAYRQLAVDMFDATTSLQLGTASINLQGLLRQGHSHADCVVRAPLFDAFEALTVQQTGKPARSGAVRKESGCSAAVSRGVLQVRPGCACKCLKGPLSLCYWCTPWTASIQVRNEQHCWSAGGGYFVDGPMHVDTVMLPVLEYRILHVLFYTGTADQCGGAATAPRAPRPSAPYSDDAQPPRASHPLPPPPRNGHKLYL
jgi:hypothetical protein